VRRFNHCPNNIVKTIPLKAIIKSVKSNVVDTLLSVDVPLKKRTGHNYKYLDFFQNKKGIKFFLG
jgi:hypothetical protein